VEALGEARRADLPAKHMGSWGSGVGERSSRLS
jgi:hypothetical protein